MNNQLDVEAEKVKKKSQKKKYKSLWNLTWNQKNVIKNFVMGAKKNLNKIIAIQAKNCRRRKSKNNRVCRRSRKTMNTNFVVAKEI